MPVIPSVQVGRIHARNFSHVLWSIFNRQTHRVATAVQQHVDRPEEEGRIVKSHLTPVPTVLNKTLTELLWENVQQYGNAPALVRKFRLKYCGF